MIMTDFLIRTFIKDSENINNRVVRRSYGAMAGIVGIICNIILSVIAVAHITGRIFLMVDRIPFFLKIIAVGTFRDKCL